jgi:photosystem II stability/assembly factor-like uncharacterized protein
MSLLAKALPIAAAASAAATGGRAQMTVTLEPQRSGTIARLQAVSAVSDRVAWASGARGTYVRTTDGGESWQARVVPGADSLEFRDLHALDAERAVLLAAGPGDRSRLYRTDDGGETWTLTFTNADPRAFYDCIDFRGSVGVAVSDAVNGRFPLLRSEDGGRSWAPFEPPGYALVPALEGEGAFAASGTCLVLASDGGVWIGTAKGGRVLRFGPRTSAASQTPVVHGPPTAGIASLAFRSDSVGVAAGGDLTRQDGYTDNVAITPDGGRTWTPGGRPPFPGPVYGLAYTRAGKPALVAVGPQGAASSPDDGRTWHRLADDNYWGLGFTAGGVGWLVGPEGRIARVTVR